MLGVPPKDILAAGLAALFCFAPLLARADDHHHHGDQGVARDLYERGEIGPLSEILPSRPPQFARRYRRGGTCAARAKWVYRLQIVGPDGRRSILDIDADTDAEGPDDPEVGQ